MSDVFNYCTGKYVCKECGHDLFRSEAKFSHDTPWPAFSKTILPDSVVKLEERKGALKVQQSLKLILFFHPYPISCLTEGFYVCSVCIHPLFSSSSKYRHGTPWPAFHNPLNSNSLTKRREMGNAYKVCLINIFIKR